MSRSLTACLALGALLAPSRAAAQTQPSDGWALNRFEPTAPGDPFFVSDHPWYSSTRHLAAGLGVDYALNPLLFQSSASGGTATSVEAVGGMLTGRVDVMGSFADRVGVGASFPVALTQSGTPVTDSGATLGAASGVAIGDLRLSARVRVFGHADRDGVSLHVGAHLWAPLGARASNTGDEGVRIEPRLIAAGRGGPVRWSLSLAYHMRPEHVAALVAVTSELRMTAAVGVVAANDRLTVGPEVHAYTSLGDPTGQGGAFSERLWGGEALLGAHYLAADAVMLGVGGGAGFGIGYGVAAARVLASVAYAPRSSGGVVYQRALDSDADGVGDPDDLCPTTPKGDHPDPARRGCPEADSDGDGVIDHDDRCVNEPQGAQRDPVNAGCPLRDRDSDGLFDHEDTCPEQPPGPRPDPSRRGCPAADRDGDGVLDHEDQCPEVAAGLLLDLQRRGCPLADGDHDQVPDATDACPAQPGPPASDARRSGCPNERVRVTESAIQVVGQVVFATNRDKIKRPGIPVLEAVADVMRGAPFIRRLSIEGHTDDRSTPERDLDLSERRARAVMRWLIQHGVVAERLESHGFGQSRPVASNESEDGRAQNRRVEFRIVDPAPVGASNAVTASTATPTATPAEEPRRGRHGRHGGGHHGGHHRRR